MTINITPTQNNISAVIFMLNKADTSANPSVTVWKIINNMNQGQSYSVDVNFFTYSLQAGYPGRVTFPTIVKNGTAHSFMWDDQQQTPAFTPLTSSNPNAIEVTNNTNGTMWVALKGVYAGQSDHEAPVLLQAKNIAPSEKVVLEMDTVLYVLATETGLYQVEQEAAWADLATYATPVNMNGGDQSVSIPAGKDVKKLPTVADLYRTNATYRDKVGEYHRQYRLDSKARREGQVTENKSDTLYSELEQLAWDNGVDPHKPGVDFPDGGLYYQEHLTNRGYSSRGGYQRGGGYQRWGGYNSDGNRYDD